MIAEAPWSVRAAAELELRRRRALARPSAPAPDPPGVMFQPRSDPQRIFEASTADIAIIGGSVFGGKTWSLTYEPMKYIHVPGFTFVTFRRVTPEIRNVGGLWAESMVMYPFFGGTPREHQLEWDFRSGAKGKFAGLQYDKDVLDWKSSQICLLQFDQLEELSEYQFWYMLSRNRSTCGVRPRIRGSCNPDPDSFLAGFLAWWIEDATGYAIPERSGMVRWFIRVNDTLVWADRREDLVAQHPDQGQHARSVSFILSRLQDNQVGTEKDPEYVSRVKAMPYVEQERLLGGDRGGNWRIRSAAGLVFDRSKFGDPVNVAPVAGVRLRAWDKAATPGGGDWTAGVRLAIAPDKLIYVEDVIRGQWGSGDREAVIKQTASLDGQGVRIFLEQEPGSGGKDSAGSSIKSLAGYTVTAERATGDKVARAGPFASQVKAGNVRLVRGPWNEAFLRELHAFPTKGAADDQVDAAAHAYNQLALHHVSFTPVRVRMG
jgi:predicted phage terminase large subunit-like protein